MNIVSLAMNFLTPAIVNRIASSLGIQSSFAQKAIAAALPTILGMVIGKSSSPTGLDALTGVLGKQDTSILGNLGSLIGGSGQASIVNAGTGALGSLFGNDSLGALVGAVSKFSGADANASKSLVGMLAPVALGTIAQQQKANSLDAAGLAKMLAGQKDVVAQAMPAGFGDLLQGTGLLNGVLPAAAAAAAPKVAVATGHTAVPPRAGGLSRWLPWVAAAAVLALAANFLIPTTPTTPPAPKQVVFNNVNVTQEAEKLFDTFKTSLGDVKDEASAQAQLPKLQQAARQLDQLESMQKQMPAVSRTAVASLIGGYVPQVQGLVKKAMDIAGVPAILQPLLEGIVNKMIGMSKV